MARKVYAFTSEGFAKLHDAYERVVNEVAALRREMKGARTGATLCLPPDMYIAQSPSDPGGGIPARSGTTPGSAECELYFINTSGELAKHSHLKEDVYNLSESAVAAGVYIQVKRDSLSGKLLCDYEDCGA